MKKLFSTFVITAVISAGLFAAPASADNKFILKIGDGYHGYDGWHGHHRHQGWHKKHGWKHRARWHDDDDFYYIPHRPVIVRHTYVNYAPPTRLGWNDPPQPHRYCREYHGPINVGGRVQQGYGTACYMPDGSWQMMD